MGERVRELMGGGEERKGGRVGLMGGSEGGEKGMLQGVSEGVSGWYEGGRVLCLPLTMHNSETVS